jgi:hypothetical protein
VPGRDNAAKAPEAAAGLQAPAAAEVPGAAAITGGMGNAQFGKLVSGSAGTPRGRPAASDSPDPPREGGSSDPVTPRLAMAVAARREARAQDPRNLAHVTGGPRLQRFWPFSQPKTPESPNMAPRIAALKNEQQVYLNLSTAYINRGQEGMDRLVADIDTELTKFAPGDKPDVMAVVNGQKQKIEQHRERFVPTFETSARDTAFVLLDTSQKSIRDEMARYGMQEGTELKDGQQRPSGKMDVKPTAEMDELAKAAKHLTTEGEKLANLGIQLKQKYGEKHQGGPMEEAQNRQQTERDLLKDPSYATTWLGSRSWPRSRTTRWPWPVCAPAASPPRPTR